MSKPTATLVLFVYKTFHGLSPLRLASSAPPVSVFDSLSSPVPPVVGSLIQKCFIQSGFFFFRIGPQTNPETSKNPCPFLLMVVLSRAVFPTARPFFGPIVLLITVFISFYMFIPVFSFRCALYVFVFVLISIWVALE